MTEQSRGVVLTSQAIKSVMNSLTLARVQGPDLHFGDVASSEDAATLGSMVCGAQVELVERRRAGDAVAEAILALASEEWAGTTDAKPNSASSDGSDAWADWQIPLAELEARGGSLLKILNDIALENFDAGLIGRAVVVLATLLCRGADRGEALSDLAVCAARLNKLDEALTLAMECIKGAVKIPRAYFIAGLCELARGHEKKAQGLLAIGARIARGRPEYRMDLQAAQRLLLIMHFV
jgi:hypothetical protein